MSDAWLDTLQWNEQGLIPAIAQDQETGTILMMAWMNREALAATAATGKAVYWSRSRGKLWRKGESSGHTQLVADIQTDCDADVVLLKVSQLGGIACHTGRYSCFYRELRESAWHETAPVLKDPGEIYPDASGGGSGSESAENPEMSDQVLENLARELENRKSADAADSYVASLYRAGTDTILKKVGEEATETIIAVKSGKRDDIVHETADLWFHTLVMLAHQGLGPDHVLQELQRRFGQSGHDEKASRTNSIDK